MVFFIYRYDPVLNVLEKSCKCLVNMGIFPPYSGTSRFDHSFA